MSTFREEVWSLRNSNHQPTKERFDALWAISKEICQAGDPLDQERRETGTVAATVDGGTGPDTSKRPPRKLWHSQQCQLNCPQVCPKPINYLVNAEPPKSWTDYGLAGRIPHNILGFYGCNFSGLQPLAAVKAPRVTPSDLWLRGFSGGTSGLATMFGGWSDYCLWTWSQCNAAEVRCPTVILSKDNSPLSAEQLYRGRDWGFAQIADVLNFPAAHGDQSTRNLFGGLEQASLAAGRSLEQYVGENRLFIYNVWPWFRCGRRASGDAGIIADFAKVPALLNWTRALIQGLKPCKIVILGDWGFSKANSPMWSGGAVKQICKLSHPCLWHKPAHTHCVNDFITFLMSPCDTSKLDLLGKEDIDS